MTYDMDAPNAHLDDQQTWHGYEKSENMDVDAEHEVDDLADKQPKKRRRVIKTSEKKYDCPHPGCEKTYSRAEHLYRHQLNHTPKQIYRCDFPGCDRNFVRADLCTRHKERHTAKGSHLQRKDAFLNSHQKSNGVSSASSPPDQNALTASPVEETHVPHENVPTAEYALGPDAMRPFQSVPQSNSGTAMANDSQPMMSNVDSQYGQYHTYPGAMNGTHYPVMPHQAQDDDQRFNFNGSVFTRPDSRFSGFGSHQTMPLNTMHPPPITTPQSAGHAYTPQPFSTHTPTNQNLRSPMHYSHLPPLPPFGLPEGYGQSTHNRSGGIVSPVTTTSTDQRSVETEKTNSIVGLTEFDQFSGGYAMPVFGSESILIESHPSSVDETFLNMLFNANGSEINDPSPQQLDGTHSAPPYNGPLPKLEPDGTPSEQSIPSFGDGVDMNMPESVVSEKKQERLVKLISSFTEVERNCGRKSKSEILAGSSKSPGHVMGLSMLKTYITSYWLHIHPQMPILHRPTFNTETCPDTLLLAMMCLGAASLERIHPFELSQMSAELAFFVAYHIRWDVFKDAEFRPPAKLWTFQTMLLLELFEKMYSTRSLHERAHIHHATTLTVMRRGSSLIGRSAIDSPRAVDDPTRTPPGPDGTINTSGQNTTDAYWNRWITAEATRRAAFAAFIIDSTHATLFGHSAVMSPHDIRLPLPCDEALWSATSSAEVQRVEASLAANGFKPLSFLDGLRRTLNGQKIRTNTFGRVVIMSSLLNLAHHLNMQDLQVSSLGAASGLGNQMKWRSPLTRAFDFWRRDFDESLSKNDQWLRVSNPKNKDRGSIEQRDSVFEARTCLHSLAHMAMHVEITDCQVFAGAGSALGRLVTDSDRVAVQRRMREQWAPSARARDATFYALRFLCEVLIPEEELVSKRPHPHQPPTFDYNARDDSLLNRPWVLYFATLIVWSYGYALDGPIRPSNYTLTTHEIRVRDMQRYLIRMGGVASPDDLGKLKDRNSCLGLLLLLREGFQQARWELLQEASETLGSCIDLLLPGHNSDARQ